MAERRALVEKGVRAELAQLKRLKAAGVESWKEVRKNNTVCFNAVFLL